MQNNFLSYWKYYGGFRAIIKSWYFFVSLIIVLCLIIFLYNDDNPPLWYAYNLSLIPILLGFSLGGYSFLLALSDKKFLSLFIDPYNSQKNYLSPFKELNATFIHFILIQFMAIFIGLIGSLFNFTNIVFFTLGLFALFYALMTGIAATMGIFKISLLYGEFLESEKISPVDSDTKPSKTTE
jgi:hypothetical protein